MDRLGDAIPYPLMVEWGVHMKLTEEEREERRRIAQAEAETDKQLRGMNDDPHWRKRMRQRRG